MVQSNWSQAANLLVPGLPRASQIMRRQRTAIDGFAEGPAVPNSGTWAQVAQSSLPGSIPQSAVAATAPVAAPVTRPVEINPFWQGGDYGGRTIGDGNTPQDWYYTDIGEGSGDDFVQGEWERFLSDEGFGGFDRRSMWARSLFSRAMAGYEAAKQSNPEIRFRQYLGSLRGYLNDAWAGLTGNQRGVGVPTQTKSILWG
jgi:hypothetical protein